MAEQKRIGPYRLLEVLGTGGMGTVFKVYDDRLRRPLAIKVIRHDRMDRPENVDRLQREALAVASLNHPYLVQLYDLVEWDGGYGLAMELVEGVTLARQLEDGPLAVDTAVHLLSEITEGLAAIHEQGLLHRDLKSENVMITPHGHVKIMDFGLADVIRPNDSEDLLPTEITLSGTPRALSPEAIEGTPLDARSDLFSLGVLAYEVLTGARPFQGRSLIRILGSIAQEPHVPVRELRPEVPAELSSLVDRLLEKDPGDRPANAREVLEALRGFVPGLSTAGLGKATRSGSDADPWSRTETGSITSIDITGSAALDAPAGLGWDLLVQRIRFTYYRLFPAAAYRRYAALVDKSFRAPLNAQDERELTALEEHFDRLDNPRMRAVRDDLIFPKRFHPNRSKKVPPESADLIDSGDRTGSICQ